MTPSSRSSSARCNPERRGAGNKRRPLTIPQRMKWLVVVSMLTWGQIAAKDPNTPDVQRASSGPPTDTVPPLTIVVEAPPDITQDVVEGMLQEALAIWAPAHLAFQWHLADPRKAPAEPHSVRVILGDRVGAARATQRPLGWVAFSASGAPEPVIELSRGNAVWMLDANSTDRELPTRGREMLLERALGRALAHELGHYLLSMKSHTSDGLMRGVHSRDEFFSTSRAGFQPNRQELAMLAW